MFIIPLTISEIARLAGISKTTVSRALNQPNKVKPETREKIQAIIEQHEYVPNPLAKALSTGHSNMIGMLLPTLTNTVFSQMAEGCQYTFLKHRLHLVMISTQIYRRQRMDILKEMDQRQVQGFIISGSDFTEDSFKEILDNLQVPAVILEKMSDPLEYSSVYIDDEQGLQDALDYFLSGNHRNIGVISGEQHFLTSIRRLNAIKKHVDNKPVHLGIENARFEDMESGRLALNRLMAKTPRPTAVICLNDLIALGALKGSSDLGLSVPEDLEIIGFDNIPMTSYSTPALSTIHSPNTEMGMEAARALVEHIKNPAKQPYRKLLPVKLIHRGTTRQGVI